MALASFQVFFSSRISTVLFLFGKTLRFLFYLGFLVYITKQTNALSGYTLWNIVLFYLTFSLLDSVIQMLFKEVYRFRSRLIDGSFDLLLLKPVNCLFRSLFGETDLLDFITLIPFLIGIVYVGSHIPGITLATIVLYIVLLLNSLIIATSFHIAILAFGILSSEVDNIILLYRDVTTMGKLPIDIYKDPIRSFITFIIPVGIMMTFPAKALQGLLSIPLLGLSFIVSGGFLWVSLIFWNRALKRYTSAAG